MTRKLQHLEESWIICGGLPLHYWQSTRTDYPEGPTLIHLHGFGISGSYLLPTADELAAGYRTFVPDLPGYGRSTHPDHVNSIPELAQAVIHFMDAVGIEQATLIGNSMGCIISIETAFEAPDRIERVVLVSPAGGRNNRPIFKGVSQLALDSFREPLSMYVVAIPDYLRFGLINAGRLFWQMVHYPTVERFRDTNSSTLVVLGARDPLVNEVHITEGTLENEHVQIVRIDGAAHAINYSHPGKLAILIRQYLVGHPLIDDEAFPGTAVILRQSTHGATPSA
jgi:pimeloyl-ACP methyl ester carboxylesterase